MCQVTFCCKSPPCCYGNGNRASASIWARVHLHCSERSESSDQSESAALRCKDKLTSTCLHSSNQLTTPPLPPRDSGARIKSETAAGRLSPKQIPLWQDLCVYERDLAAECGELCVSLHTAWDGVVFPQLAPYVLLYSTRAQSLCSGRTRPASPAEKETSTCTA